MEDNLYILVLTSYVCFCGRVVTASFDCTFDEGLCSWQQVKGDDFNWKLIVHNISQNEWTQSHHTPGAGGYMYINSTNRKANEYARLVSPRKSAGRHCLSFWYYMKGDNKLCIKIKEGTQERLLSSITYNSSMWLVKQLNLTAKKRFKIFIDGMFINIDTFGEIAFDDIKLFSGKCPLGCKDPALEFGREMSKDYKIGSTVNISCISGYRLEGDSVIHCLTNGSWNYRPKCLPVDCNMPPLAREMISNISEGTTYNKTIRLGCSEGYTLVGNATITCQADGNWTVMPSCIVNSCKDPTPEFGTLMNKDFEIGSTVNISCMSGYKLKGNAKIDCLSNGSWSCRPICLPVDCSDPTPFSGSVSSNNFTYQSSIEVKCDPGYMLKGHSQITCQANSTWSEIPECDIINCNDPTPMAGIISSKNFTYQTVIKVKCNLGYTLKGHSQITCQDNSSWSDKPVCDQNNCSRPILSDGLYVDQSNSTPYSGVISLACADGYKMNGNSTVFCLDNHTWTLFPTCTEAVLPSDGSGSDAHVAVVVLVPLLVIGFLTIAIIYISRKRNWWCMKIDAANDKPDIDTPVQYVNGIYDGSDMNANSCVADKCVEQDEEYAIISEENSSKTKTDVVYYNIGNFKKDEHHKYDHTIKAFGPILDCTYSHIKDNKNNTESYQINQVKPESYSHTNSGLKGSRFQAETDEYNHIEITKPKESRPIQVKQTYEEPDYDHAKAGGCDPVIPELDEYSHLNLTIRRHRDLGGNDCYYSQQSIPTDQTPQYFILEKDRIQSAAEKDRQYYVLEEGEREDETSIGKNHEYFILENTE